MIVARVPATSANLGAGFDCLGLALHLHNDVALIPAGPFRVEITGEGADSLPRDRANLVARTVYRFFDEIGRTAPPFALRLTNRIPMTGGLGSSSTAIVGGLLVANRFADEPLGRDDLLRLAVAVEGHPDNVAPAMLGGLVLSVVQAEQLTTVQVPMPTGLRAVLFLPGFTISTREARRRLPSRVPLSDAVFNVGRSTLFVAAMATGRLELLRTATQDRLHQQYRQVLFPAMPRLFDAALDAGALGAWLSGAGSALMALVQGDAEGVIQAFDRAARANGVAGRAVAVDLSPAGATILEATTREGETVAMEDAGSPRLSRP
ncbi:MAG TPA: homoserine kinase [Chloroflexota bacterium]|nr:homoserine kinase [Chloroflexota bacterium]